ncbi:NADPH-dependent F420 reductase [Actinoplanes aureus]|uniref:NAD(P)-binding domain-containing protein n=1 Tax=Actinoplanes aureus TaxID=2792083 RepID=A0A931CEM9_9ACTN|nr:NAD(P)-binding domain-containing protein [Actinoplanes aureus]MBG0566092.1 NAD(P)-binding domain-containing protein [Actinoplanes aureus]
MTAAAVGIIGAGRMGTALARALTAAGVPTALCTARDSPESTLDHLLRHTRIVLLALPFPVALGLVSGPVGRCGGGRTLIDATNPGFCRDRMVPPGLSGGEIIAAAANGWRTVKAFNTVAADHLAATRIGGSRVTMPVAGPAEAKPAVFELAARLGFDPLDAGGIESSREMEDLAVLMARISTAYGLHGRIGIRIGELDHAPVAVNGQGAATA